MKWCYSWINVTDKLPELEQRVLTIDNSGYIEICQYGHRDKYDKRTSKVFMNEQDEQTSEIYPTHWMQLPNPPK